MSGYTCIEYCLFVCAAFPVSLICMRTSCHDLQRAPLWFPIDRPIMAVIKRWPANTGPNTCYGDFEAH